MNPMLEEEAEGFPVVSASGAVVAVSSIRTWDLLLQSTCFFVVARQRAARLIDVDLSRHDSLSLSTGNFLTEQNCRS